MELKVLERKPDKLRLEVMGEDHTLLNILREKAWDAGAKQAAYIIEHPYLSNPSIIVRAKSPQKVLAGSAQLIVDETREFSSAFRRALRK